MEIVALQPVRVQPMSERDALLAAVCENPFCKTTKLVFADYLDENGECGQAMRWAVKNGKRPRRWLGAVMPDFWYWRPRSYLYPSAAGLPSCLIGRRREGPLVGSAFVHSFYFTSERHNWAEFLDQPAAWNWFIERFGEAMAKGKIGYRSRKKPKTVNSQQ